MPMVFRLQHKIMCNLGVRCLKTFHQNQVHEGGQQGDPLGGALFVFAHLHVLCFTTTFHLTYVFILLANDTHIVGPTPNVVPVFLQL
jgi:hypothetical protein